MSDKKRKCSGSRCPMQHNTINVGECKCTDTCEWYTPVADLSGMEAVIDMAIKQFRLESNMDKQKIRILFNAYVGQYIASCFPLGEHDQSRIFDRKNQQNATGGDGP